MGIRSAMLDFRADWKFLDGVVAKMDGLSLCFLRSDVAFALVWQFTACSSTTMWIFSGFDPLFQFPILILSV